MNTRVMRLVAVVSLIATASLQAQLPEVPKPQKEHDWLQKFVGKWEVEMEAVMGPGQDPVKSQGTITSRMLGKFWVVNEMQGDMMGTPVTGLQTLGYDSKEKKYVGTWVDSATTHMWHYEGTVDEAGTRIVLEATGPNPMAEGKQARYRDSYEFKSDSQMVLESSMQGDDGKWITFMTGTARRAK